MPLANMTPALGFWAECGKRGAARTRPMVRQRSRQASPMRPMASPISSHLLPLPSTSARSCSSSSGFQGPCAVMTRLIKEVWGLQSTMRRGCHRRTLSLRQAQPRPPCVEWCSMLRKQGRIYSSKSTHLVVVGVQDAGPARPHLHSVNNSGQSQVLSMTGTKTVQCKSARYQLRTHTAAQSNSLDTCCVVRSGSAFAICCQAPPEAAVYTPGVVRDLNSHCMSSWLWPCAAAYLHRKQASAISRWSYMPATSSLKHLVLLLQCTILSSRFSCFVCWCQNPRSSIVSASASEWDAQLAHSLTAWRMMSFSFSENLPRFTSVRCRSDAHEPSCRGRPRFLPLAVTEASPPMYV